MMMSKEEIETIGYVISGVAIAYWITKNWRVFLRDYFAAKAMQAFISATREQLIASDIDLITKSSYILADSMLKAREQ